MKDRLVLIPRIYTNKPRTTGTGYKGMMHQPDPHKEPNISEGIKAIRSMHIRALRETGLSAADEMLYPGNAPYLEDLLSYNAIGARSVENQQHRLTQAQETAKTLSEQNAEMAASVTEQTTTRLEEKLESRM